MCSLEGQFSAEFATLKTFASRQCDQMVLLLFFNFFGICGYGKFHIILKITKEGLKFCRIQNKSLKWSVFASLANL